MGVPYTFSTASQSIPLAQLDSNFATPITLGQTTAALGQTVTTITGLTLANVNITSGNVVANASGNITFGNTTVSLGNSSSSIGNLTLNNTIINSGNISSAVIPTANGTVMLSGNMPAFSAYQSSNQSLSSMTWTKIVCDTEEYDTNANYNNSTYRFTPTVAGYYLITGCIGNAGNFSTSSAVYKNGVEFKRGNNISANYNNTVSAVIYCNGSTDYIELYGYFATGTLTQSGQSQTYFQATLIKGA